MVRRRRLTALPQGTLSIDNLDGPERRRWPAERAEELLRGSGHTYAELKKLYDAGQALPWFEIPATLQVKLKFDSTDVSSDNLLAALPGSDPALANEYVVVSAHLDGYDFGSPIHGPRTAPGAAALVPDSFHFSARSISVAT